MARTADEPLRVCVISHACAVATNQIPWAALVARYPVEVTVLAPRTWRTMGGRHVRLEVWPGLDGSVLPMTVWPQGHPNLHLWLGLAGALRRVQPDVVFLDGEPYSPAAGQVLMARRGASWGLVVWTLQNLVKRFPAPIAALQRRVFEAADVMAAVHPTARDVLIQQGCRTPVRLLPLVVDPELYSPGDPGPERRRLGLDGFVLGFSGRLVREKGVADLIEAVARLEARGAGPLSLVVVGDGPERAALEKAARRLRGRVVFTGAVPHEQTPSLYRAMDVCVLPSRTAPHWREQFGRALAEALACGAAVIGSDSGSIPAMVEMTAGIVFPEGDVEALVRALEGLMADPAAAARTAEEGRRRVVEALSPQAVAEALFGILSEAAQARGR